MEKTLLDFGFEKNGLYSWNKDNFSIVIYFDGLTITNDETGEVLYDGLVPHTQKDEMDLIEHYTKLKIMNERINNLLLTTKSSRIFSNTSLYLSNLLINYFTYNTTTEEEICKKLNIDKQTLKLYLSGTYDFKLTEIAKISILVNKTICIK
ncbi:hypothetical protein M0Q97_02540 [Candidatus Dojkabacteria bacterium]|jgi:hypothetical protein|nr:hypothetical protein [Candidatus Dojkabacteria bacterium]